LLHGWLRSVVNGRVRHSSPNLFRVRFHLQRPAGILLLTAVRPRPFSRALRARHLNCSRRRRHWLDGRIGRLEEVGRIPGGGGVVAFVRLFDRGRSVGRLATMISSARRQPRFTSCLFLRSFVVHRSPRQLRAPCVWLFFRHRVHGRMNVFGPDPMGQTRRKMTTGADGRGLSKIQTKFQLSWVDRP
jgi:hypothetical protein